MRRGPWRFLFQRGRPCVAVTSVPRADQKRTWGEKRLITPGGVGFRGRNEDPGSYAVDRANTRLRRMLTCR